MNNIFKNIPLWPFVLLLLISVSVTIQVYDSNHNTDEHTHHQIRYIQFYTFTYCEEHNKVLKDGEYVEPTRLEKQRIKHFKNIK